MQLAAAPDTFRGRLESSPANKRNGLAGTKGVNPPSTKPAHNTSMRRSLLILTILALAAPLGVHAEGGKKAKPTYLPLETLAASVRNSAGRRGVLTVEVGLDAPDPKLRDRLELYQPLLRSAYVSAHGGVVGRFG